MNMPGPQNPPRPPALSSVPPMACAALFCARKVRVVCMDPDATDSSSGEDDKFSPKRLVREISIPPKFSFRFSQLEDAKSRSVCTNSSPELMGKSLSRKRKMECNHSARTSSRKCELHGTKEESRQRSLRSMSRGKEVRHRSFAKWANCKQPINTTSSSSCCNSKQIFSPTHKSFSLPQASTELCRNSSLTSWRSMESASVFQKNVHSLANGKLPSVNDTGSSRCMDDDKYEVLRLCLDMESVEQCPLMVSASSASESTVCNSSALPASVISVKVSSDALSDEGSTGSVSSLDACVASSTLVDQCNTSHVCVAAQPTMAPGGKPDDASILSPLLDELPPVFDFGQMLDIEGSGNCVTGEDIPHMSDPFDDFLTGGGEFDGMSFDLDSEALAWINVSEVCAV